MSVKVGDQLPDGELKETTEFDSATSCAMAPKDVKIAELPCARKKVAIFGVPGAVHADVFGEARPPAI